MENFKSSLGDVIVSKSSELGRTIDTRFDNMLEYETVAVEMLQSISYIDCVIYYDGCMMYNIKN